MKKSILLSSIFLMLSLSFSYAQLTTTKEPLFTEFGPIYPVPDVNFRMDKDSPMKVVFDVSRKLRDSSRVNPSIETAARYLNLHLKNGYKPEHLKVAVVIHGRAVKDMLSSTYYQQEFSTDNPNTELINALLDAGVELVLCGQSSAYHGVNLSKSIPGVQMALSAMTALVHLQNEGYRLVAF